MFKFVPMCREHEDEPQHHQTTATTNTTCGEHDDAMSSVLGQAVLRRSQCVPELSSKWCCQTKWLKNIAHFFSCSVVNSGGRAIRTQATTTTATRLAQADGLLGPLACSVVCSAVSTPRTDTETRHRHVHEISGMTLADNLEADATQNALLKPEATVYHTTVYRAR